MFQSNERVTVDLSGLVIKGVSFSQLLFSFKGISRPTRVRWRSDRAVCSWELNCSP